MKRGGLLGVQRGEGLEEFRNSALLDAFDVPEFSVLSVSGFIERFVARSPHRFMRFTNGLGRNFAFDAISVALDQNFALVHAALVKMDLPHDFFSSKACNSSSFSACNLKSVLRRK